MKTVRHCLLLVLFFVSTAGPGYAQDLILTGTLTSGRHIIYENITTQGATIINPGVNLDLAARNTIIFQSGFEVKLGGHLRAGASPDTDTDTILDIIEKWSGCQNHLSADTDGDGLADNEEDTNKNGIHEPELNETSACSDDTDGDGMKDKWELDNNLNPLVDDTDDDPDGDGLSNYYEHYFNTDPQDGGSLPSKRTYYEYDGLGRIKKIIRIK